MVVERNNLERTFSQLRSRCNLQRKALASVEDEIVRVRRELVACPRGSALRLPASHQSEMKSESSCLMHSVERELSAERALSQQFASCESRVLQAASGRWCTNVLRQANEIRDNFQGLRIDTEREQQLCQLLSRHVCVGIASTWASFYSGTVSAQTAASAGFFDFGEARLEVVGGCRSSVRQWTGSTAMVSRTSSCSGFRCRTETLPMQSDLRKLNVMKSAASSMSFVRWIR
mmetsp:Transcript_62477/g.167295  ORF Transcript_62477/g.167295 Transcript_62477/m.167295 type:complete len:232 (+) Transcript_62477:182-877(+)